MYKTYRYNNMPRPITASASPPPKPEPRLEPKPEPRSEPKPEPPKPAAIEKPAPPKPHDDGLFGNLQVDDLVLLAVIFVLLMDDCDDKLLLAALGLIFINGLNE